MRTDVYCNPSTWENLVKPIVLLFILSLALPVWAQAGPSNPKVRAITAFVRLDRNAYQKQVSDTLIVLGKLKARFEATAYEVETVRITTQPLAEVVSGLTEDQALDFLTTLDQLSAKENFALNIGPATLHEGDDPATLHLLEKALSRLTHIQSSAVIADEDGIHWKSLRETAELLKFVSEHSPGSTGTFQFAATAMLKPYSPFFPGSYHTGTGQQFAIGLESANLVRDVLAKDRGDVDRATSDLTAALAKHAAVVAAI